MKKPFIIVLLFIFVNTLFYSQSSRAAIGVIAKSKVTKTVGGVTAATGGVISGSSFLFASSVSNLGAAIIGIVGIYIGAVTAGIGLIILDDKTIAELNFDRVNYGDFEGISENDVDIYNSELQMLNSIKETIAVELPDDTTIEQAGESWKVYSEMLSAETMKVASKVSQLFLKQ